MTNATHPRTTEKSYPFLSFISRLLTMLGVLIILWAFVAAGMVWNAQSLPNIGGFDFPSTVLAVIAWILFTVVGAGVIAVGELIRLLIDIRDDLHQMRHNLNIPGSGGGKI